MTRCCIALLLAVFALPALGDDALLGQWALATIGEQELPDNQRVTYDFSADTVRITLGSSGLAQTWELPYTTSDEGELTLEPADGPGDPAPTTFDYRIEDGKLILEVEGFGAAMTFTRADAGE